ncbi:helix-turn-helix domain-containing protein [Terrabacter sp. 2RAF25]|uniref:helix-turn-helix domain-containing protein n=1 Tax=Terrabacter sp. 2RAF25 TaxID=3232998 RepID=UPI003F9D79E7
MLGWLPGMCPVTRTSCLPPLDPDLGDIRCSVSDQEARTGRKAAPRTRVTDAFAAQLRAAREQKKISQGELAQRSGVGRQTILRIENRARVMDISQLGALCEALDIGLLAFCQRVEEELHEGHARPSGSAEPPASADPARLDLPSQPEAMDDVHHFIALITARLRNRPEPARTRLMSDLLRALVENS